MCLKVHLDEQTQYPFELENDSLCQYKDLILHKHNYETPWEVTPLVGIYNHQSVSPTQEKYQFLANSELNSRDPAFPKIKDFDQVDSELESKDVAKGS